MRVLIVDNYDSFSFNIYQRVGEITGEAPRVCRNDEIDLETIEGWQPDRILLSPGPGRPERPDSCGIGGLIIDRFGPRIPILGICLGHQAIVHRLGGRIVRSPVPRHGKTSPIHHDGRGLFEGLPQPFEAMRYHSLIAQTESLPPCLEATAWTADGLLMGVRHRSWPLQGVQFHPESIGTAHGPTLLAGFLQVEFLEVPA